MCADNSRNAVISCTHLAQVCAAHAQSCQWASQVPQAACATPVGQHSAVSAHDGDNALAMQLVASIELDVPAGLGHLHGLVCQDDGLHSLLIDVDHVVDVELVVGVVQCGKNNEGPQATAAANRA